MCLLADHLVGASWINPAGFTMTLCAAFAQLVSAGSGSSVVARALMIALSGVVFLAAKCLVATFVQSGATRTFFGLVDDGQSQLALRKQREWFFVQSA